jgi:hypothetical protein
MLLMRTRGIDMNKSVSFQPNVLLRRVAALVSDGCEYMRTEGTLTYT